MGTTETSQRLARTAKVRIYMHEDGGPPYSVSWHWQGWDTSDGTVVDTSGGSYTGDAEEVMVKVSVLMGELHQHMTRCLDPFPPTDRYDERPFPPDQVVADLDCRLHDVSRT